MENYLEKIVFENNKAPWLNDVNLNKIQDNIESAITKIYNQQEALKSRIPIGENIQWLDCKVLYESETGFNTGNVDLIDIIGNYDFIEIYYKRSNLINTTGKLPISSNSFGTTLHTISSQAQYLVVVYFDNSKISIGFDYELPFNGGGVKPSTEVAIIKVIGYKNSTSGGNQ